MAADPAMTWSAPFRSTRRSAALPVDPDADRVDALICVDPRAARRARGHSTAHHGCGPLPRVRKPPRLPARPPAGWPGSARTRRRGAASLGRRRRPTVRSRAGRPPGRAPAYGRRQAAVLPPALARPVSREAADAFPSAAGPRKRSSSASSGGRPRTASCRRRKNSLTSSRLIDPRGRYQCQMLLYRPSSARVRRRGSASGRIPCSMPRTRNVAHANSTSRIRARASVRASSS